MSELEGRKDIESEEYRPNKLSAKFHLLLGILFFLGAGLLFTGLGSYICSYLAFGEFVDSSQLAGLGTRLIEHPLILKLYVFFTSSLPMIVAALLACIFIKATPRDYLTLNKPQSGTWFGFSLLFVFISLPLMGFMLEINNLIDFSRWPEFYEWLQKTDSGSNKMYEAMIGKNSSRSFITSLLFMAALPAFAEEVLFRGFLMSAFHGIFRNIHVAIIVTALLFSLLHLQFTKFIPMFFLATVFGYAAYWSGTIWTSIIAHFINNALAVVQLHFVTDGSYKEALEQGSGLPIVVNLFLVVGVALLFAFINKKSNVKKPNFYV